MNDLLAQSSRSQRLKTATHQAHDRLDQRIMAAQPFASREHYARFLQVQYRFHCDMERVYGSPVLASVVPELALRQRLSQVRADLADMGVAAPEVPPAETEYLNQVTGLGWLYVAEGSNLGAAILFKLAAKLGLDEGFGARHLAGHPDGRARHWREFVAALERVTLSESQEQAVIGAARDAFTRVREYVDLYMRVAG